MCVVVFWFICGFLVGWFGFLGLFFLISIGINSVAKSQITQAK